MILATLLTCSVEPKSPSLRLPIDCVVGEDCWISTRPDDDPGPGSRDHSGGTSTRDGHSGTDVAVANAGQAEGTWVVAPAAGTVLRSRDLVPDGELLAGTLADVADHQCGNGMVLDIGGGWQLELCHFHSGTVQVKPGDHVDVGARLGRIGWSGEADHPHVHLTVNYLDRPVDPFNGTFLDDGTPAAPGPLWAVSLPSPLEMGSLAWAGFGAGPISDMPDWPIDGGRSVIPASAPSLVLSAFTWRPIAGDIVDIEIRSPHGTTLTSHFVEPRDRPRELWSREMTWPADHRPVGLWTAKVVWRRGAWTRELRTSTVLR